jgi:Uncharacterised protein family UPF0564
MREEAECKITFKANHIPKTTTEPLYQRIQEKEKARRAANKEESLARTKATQKPFSFYERDVEKARDAALRNEDIDTHMLNQFRARIIPWRVLVPRFKMMCEKAEHEREQRIRANAQKSLASSKLPPRMQQHVDEKRKRLEDNLESTQSTLEESQLGFTFQPPRARSVPNFQRLQKAFVTQMEQRKKAVAPTIPKPFNFHQPKPSARLRTYMDEANQVINPTMRMKRSSYSLTKITTMRDPNVEEPATTKKHDAYVAKRRE